MHSIELIDLRSGARGRKSLGLRRSDHIAAGLPNGDVVVLGGSVGMIFNNFASHRYARIRLPPRWRRAARRVSGPPPLEKRAATLLHETP